MQEVFYYSNRLIKSVKSNFQRYLLAEINWEYRLIEILGARGVGKTTLMLQKAKALNKEKVNQAVYLSLDDKLLFQNSLVDIAEELDKFGVKYLFFDEVHKYPLKYKGFDWSAEIKNIYDRLPGLNIVYSGSSALNIYKGHGDLSRRKSSYKLNGFSFREYLKFNGVLDMDRIELDSILVNHQEISSEITSSIKIIPHFKMYLKYGYFPFYNDGPDFYFDRINNILNVVLETDIPAVSDISFQTTFKLKKLLAAIASSAPYVPNLVKLRNELMVTDQRTLLKYLDFLEKAEVITSLSQKVKGNKIMQKPDKIYLANPNYFYSLSIHEEIGTIRETFFESQLRLNHKVTLPLKGDFLVDDKFVIEIGGKNKTSKQIRNLENAFLVLDDIEIGVANQIPLWLFGFLY